METDAMNQSHSPLQTAKRPWYRPFGGPKYDQIRHHTRGELVIEDCEPGGCSDFHSLDRKDNESDRDSNISMTLLPTLTSCLPRCLADSVHRKIRQKEGQQREWVISVLLCAFCAFIVLLLNILFTIIAAALSYSRIEGQGFTSAVLYRGSCTASKNWARGLHLVINILSTVLLAASNYCMQCLCSPSRQDVENAHARGKWLDIGVASFRNLQFVGWRRCILWAILLISSLPIHFVLVSGSIPFPTVGLYSLIIKHRYNSAVFSAIGTHEYGILLASSSFDFNNPPNNSPNYTECSEQKFDMNMTAFYSEVSKFETLDKQECIDAYDADYISDRGTVVLITDAMAADNGLCWVDVGNSPRSYLSKSYSWMCEHHGNYPGVTYDHIDDPKDCHKYPCSDECLKNQCRGQCIGDWSVFSVPWSAPLLNVTVSLDVPYNVSRNYITPWHFSDGDVPEDLSNLADFLRGYPQENDLQQYISNETNWTNKSWATDPKIHNAGAECASDADLVNPHYPPFSVDYCLSQKVEEKCQLLFSLPICLTVILCNIVKIACMLMAAHDDRKEIFLRVGDAVSSFLTRSDPTTEGRCLWSKKDITGPGPKCYKKAIDIQKKSPQPATFRDKRKRWRRVTGGTNLCLIICGYPILLATALIFLILGVIELKNQGESTSFSGLWNIGFGSVASSTVINPNSSHSGTIPMVLLANAPQVAVSIAYYFCNNMLTVMSLAVEFHSYATKRKPLRVSWPKGLQRSTYYLSLPYRYCIPLLISHAILHWLVSQSLFLVDVTLYDMTGNVTPERLITCGYSPMAIIFAIILISLLLFLVLGLRYKHFRTSMPLAGSCSESISAACHPPPGGADPLKPVMWGEIPISKDTGSSQEHSGESTDYTVSRLDSSSFSDAETLNNNNQGQGNESQISFWENSNDADEGEALFHTVSISDTTRGGGANGGSNDALQCEEDEGPGHCSFSSSEVIAPRVGKSYL